MWSPAVWASGAAGIRRVGLAAVVVGQLTLIGCGGGSSEDGARSVDTSREPFSWSTRTPSGIGLDAAALLSGVGALEAADSNAHQLVVARGAEVAINAAFWPSVADEPHDVASVTKSVVALVVGAAIERGDIESLDVTVDSVLDLPRSAPAARLTLRDLLGMRTGLDCDAADGEAQLAAMLQAPDYIAYAAQLPAAGAPGETFGYCSPGYHLISATVGGSLGTSLADYAASALFEPLGITEWSWPSDPQGVTHGWGDLALRPLDLARIGRLVLDDGRWEGSRVLPAGFVEELRQPIATGDPEVSYGLGWWLPTDGVSGSLEGIGRGGQELLLWPEKDLIVVVTGAEVDGRLIARSVAGAVLPQPATDPRADAEIAARLAALAGEPSPTLGSTPRREGWAESSFDIDANPLGVDRLHITSASRDVMDIELTITGRVHQLAVGLDGVARVSADGPSGGPAALVGVWDGPVLTVDYEETLGPDHLTFSVDLGPPFTLTIADLASRFPPTAVRGSPAP